MGERAEVDYGRVLAQARYGERAPKASFERIVAVVERHPDLLAGFSPDRDETADLSAWRTLAEPVLLAIVKRRAADFSDESIRELWRDVERDLQSRRVRARAVAPVLHCRVEALLDLGPATMRVPSDDDLSRWALPDYINERDLIHVGAMIEGPFDDPPESHANANRAVELARRIVLAVQLHTNCDAHAPFVELRKDSILGVLGGRLGHIAQSYGRREASLAAPDLPALVRSVAEIDDARTRDDQAALALARWQDLTFRLRADERLVEA